MNKSSFKFFNTPMLNNRIRAVFTLCSTLHYFNYELSSFNFFNSLSMPSSSFRNVLYYSIARMRVIVPGLLYPPELVQFEDVDSGKAQAVGNEVYDILALALRIFRG